MITVNTVGVSLMLMYIIFYIYYTCEKVSLHFSEGDTEMHNIAENDIDPIWSSFKFDSSYALYRSSISDVRHQLFGIYLYEF